MISLKIYKCNSITNLYCDRPSKKKHRHENSSMFAYFLPYPLLSLSDFQRCVGFFPHECSGLPQGLCLFFGQRPRHGKFGSQPPPCPLRTGYLGPAISLDKNRLRGLRALWNSHDLVKLEMILTNPIEYTPNGTWNVFTYII